MTDWDDDDAAAAYYEDPANRQLSGQGQKRSQGRLTTHVPIRFSAQIIERVKELASGDGKTVSSWIREVVEREVLRRERSSTVGVQPTVTWIQSPLLLGSSTLSSSDENAEELQKLVV